VESRPDWIALVEAARAGDGAAQGVLLGRFERLARATARRLVDPGSVDDVVQESFTAALQALPSLRTAEAFPSWLRLIVRKQASLARRRPSEVALDGVVEPHMPDADPADLVVRDEVASVVRLALASARDQDRRLLELRHLAGWSNDELADLLGVTSGAVRKRLHDARRRLRPLVEHSNPRSDP
jgi:RNA polymerase sigma-70 factor, ECF subfamily